mgnify:CR=1 FL=1
MFWSENGNFSTARDDKDYPIVDFIEAFFTNSESFKETPILTALWQEIDQLLVKRRSAIDIERLQYNSFQLYLNQYFSKEETFQCKMSLEELYDRCRRELTHKFLWIGFASFLDMLSGVDENGDRFLGAIENNRCQEVIQIEINELIQLIKGIVADYTLKCNSIEDICDNIILFSNDELVHRFRKIKGNKWKLQRINFLFRLRKNLIENKASDFWLSLSARNKLIPITREKEILFQWIENSAREITPPLKLKSSSQIEAVKIRLIDLIERKKLSVDNVDNFIKSRFHLPSERNYGLPNDSQLETRNFSVSLGENGIATEIIDELFIMAKRLDAGNSTRDIQYWIHYLFFNFNGKGFSLKNIKKVTD